jgi:hypothetical protein
MAKNLSKSITIASRLSLNKVFFLITVLFFSQTLFCQEKPDWKRQGKYLICNVSKEYRDFWKDDYNWPIINKNWDAIAARSLKGTKWSVLLNNQPGTYYSEVRHLQFSPNGDTLIYVGMKGVNKLFRRALSVRINEERDERLYDEISPTIFSPDGKSWAYKIRDDNDWYLVVNGVESKRYDSVNNHRFSPDGSSLIFKAKLNNKSFLVTDGEEGKKYDDIFAITFNPVNSEASYWGVIDNNYYLVAGSTEINTSKQVPPIENSILFNPNGNSFAYFVRDPATDNYYVIQDGIYSNPYDRIKFEEAVYSRDGSTLVYPAGKGNQEFIVLNGREEEKFDAVKSPKFSNDNFSLIYIANQGNKWFTVINRKREKRYDMVKDVTFSTSGNFYAYFAKLNNKWFVVRNGIEGSEKFDDVSDLKFTPDGSKIVFIASNITKTIDGNVTNETKKQRVIVDSESFNEYAKITSIKITEDSKVAFIVEDRGGCFVVTDGNEGELYDSILSLEVSPDKQKFGYFAIQANKIYWVVTN